MPYDPSLAGRVRTLLGRRPGLTEREMFGGLAFLLRGRMCVGVRGAELMVRVEPDQVEALLQEPGARRFDLTGRPMRGWLVVGRGAVRGDGALRAWVDRGVGAALAAPARRRARKPTRSPARRPAGARRGKGRA